jgi:hypothetical protein
VPGLAVAELCHPTQYHVQAVEGSERTGCFLPNMLTTFRSNPPTGPLVPHLATKTTCRHSIHQSTRCYNPEDRQRLLRLRENIGSEHRALQAHHSPSGWVPHPRPPTCTSWGPRCTVFWDVAGRRNTPIRRHSDRVQGAAVREAGSEASEGEARTRRPGGDRVRGGSRRWVPCASHTRTAASFWSGRCSPETTGVPVVATARTWMKRNCQKL